MAKTNTMEKLKAKAETLVTKINGFIVDDKMSKALDLEPELIETINEYTSLAKSKALNECKATDDPMMEAIKRVTFRTIAVRDEKPEEDAKFKIKVLVDRDKPIDLEQLHKKCKDIGGIGVDKNWIFVLEKMNFLCTARVATDLGIDPKDINDSYFMDEISTKIDMGKTPTSNTKMLEQLQMCVSAMIGDKYKATSHDVAYLKEIYSKKGRKILTVSCATHKNFRNYMCEICHRIVMDTQYNCDYKKK